MGPITADHVSLSLYQLLILLSVLRHRILEVLATRLQLNRRMPPAQVRRADVNASPKRIT
jgi:hypothetical protein